MNNSYAKNYTNVEGGLFQWFDAIVEDVLDNNKLKVKYLEEIPEDQTDDPVDEEDAFGFDDMTSSTTERNNVVELEKCRPYRCLGVGEQVEVMEGANNEVRWHNAVIIENEGSSLKVKYEWEDKTISVTPEIIRPTPYIRSSAWNFAPNSFTGLGGRTADF
jgi:hypothetical protein